jgi:two-component system, OmpR family, phosphate regulon response regulator PhoB
MSGMTTGTTSGQRNTAYGMTAEDLDIVVVDPSRTMQTLIRSMIMPLRPKRLRFHDSASEALHDMIAEPPSLVFTEWRMRPMSGLRLVSVMRNATVDSLCRVPIVVVTGDATRRNVETALRSGAQAVLAKPLSSCDLRKRIEFVLADERPFERVGDAYVISGVSAQLDRRRERDRLPALLDPFSLGDEVTTTRALPGEEIVAPNLASTVPAPKPAYRPLRALSKPRATAPIATMAPKPTGTRWSQLWGR